MAFPKFAGRDTLYDSVKTEGVRKKRNRSARAYENRYRGYTEYQVKKKNGKGVKILHIYTGDYYCPAPRIGNWLTLRLLYGVLFLAAAALFLNGAIGVSYCCTNAVLVIVQVVCLWLFIWQLLTLIEYCLAGKRETESDYQTSRRLRNKCLYTLAAIAAHALVCLVSAVLFGTLGWRVLLFLLETGIAALCLFMVYQVENTLEYEKIPADPRVPEGAKRVDKYGNKRFADA